MPLKPHPTDPDKMVYESRKYDLPKREWVGLTEDQIDELEKEFIGFSVPNIYNFVQAIEAKLKARNT